VERLNALRAQQLPAVDAACRRLEGVLASDPYLQQRLCRVTVEAHSKALYSLHKCDALSALQLPLFRCMHSTRKLQRVQVLRPPLASPAGRMVQSAK
jgi:hypothetical protein